MKKCLLYLCFIPVYLTGLAQTTYDFNNSDDLTTYFNPGTTSYYTNVSSGGINNTGCVNVASSDLWTGKTPFDNNSITLSAYFYNAYNAGYGGLGIAPNNTNDKSGYCSPAVGLGVVFHGGGGMFVNNNSETSLRWSVDISLDAWFKMLLTITQNTDNTFNMTFQIWNADANGNIGTLFTEQTISDLVNTDIVSGGAVYPYFSTYMNRFNYMDDFSITGTIAATPTLSTLEVSNIDATSATGNGSITSFGSSAPTQFGVVWSTDPNPTTALTTKTIQGPASSTGDFMSAISDLAPATQYYVRAYATNGAGTSYGNEVTFTTARLDQTITFNTIPEKSYGDDIFDPGAFASSGLPVSYSSSNTAVATIESNEIRIVGAGNCFIYADQSGTGTYNSAPQASQSLIVKQKELTIANAAAQDIVYDGSTTTFITGAILNGTVTGDDVNLQIGTAVFTDKNAGNDKEVIVTGSMLTGTDVGKYFLTEISGLTADITAKQLTIADPDITTGKQYDGTTFANVKTGTLSGVISADEGFVTVSAVASYDNAGIGIHKIITVNYTLEGTAAQNYFAPVSYQVSTGIICEATALSELESSQPGCEGGTIELSYTLLTGEPVEYRLVFDETAISAGFSNIEFTSLPANSGTGIISFDIPEDIAYGTYNAQLQLRNTIGAESEWFPFTFIINLSLDYLVDKFDDVILCDNSSGQFTAYQWFKNDALINGATSQFYNDPAGLSGTYCVQVTTTDGKTLQTCPVSFYNAAAQKAMLRIYPNPVQPGQAFAVEVPGTTEEDMKGAMLQIYDNSGSVIYSSTKGESIHNVNLNVQHGTYMIRLKTEQGKVLDGKVTVIR